MMTRWLPRTLFGRMALLLVLAVLASQFLALTLLFELKLPRSFHPELVSSLGTARPPRPPLFPGLWIDYWRAARCADPGGVGWRALALRAHPPAGDGRS